MNKLLREYIEEILNEDRYSHIDFIPPESVRKAAERGLELRRVKGIGGLTPAQASKMGIGSGVQRAVNLKNGDTISPKVARKMKAFFDRHQGNEVIEPGKKPYEDAGYVSWLLWGGDPGRSWANKLVRQMNAVDKKK